MVDIYSKQRKIVHFFFQETLQYINRSFPLERSEAERINDRSKATADAPSSELQRYAQV